MNKCYSRASIDVQCYATIDAPKRLMSYNQRSKFMYYVLNFLIYLLIPFFYFFNNQIDLIIKLNVYLCCYFVINPIYLLFLNFYFIKNKNFSVIKCTTVVLSTLFSWAVFLTLADRIKTGKWFGNIPFDVILVHIAIPVMVLAAGALILRFLRNSSEHKG